MRDIKICPDCGTEYYRHVEQCADCSTALLLPEENRKVQEERELCKQKVLKNAVPVREGSLKWLDELYHVLIDSNIPCSIHSDAGCRKGCCGDTCRLLVSAADVEKANERIEEYCMVVHPELRDSRDMMSEGKCPACGSAVASDTVECPDCGLTLLIIEE